MTTVAIPPAATQRLTFAEQRAAILGMRAGLVDQEVDVCEDHGPLDEDGISIRHEARECSRACRHGVSREWVTSDFLAEELHQLGHGTELRRVAERMRVATRREVALRDRDDDLRARAGE